MSETDDLRRQTTQLAKRIVYLEGKVDRLRCSWRCFHCNKLFTNPKAAALHFGEWEGDGEVSTIPACKISTAEVRKMEAELLRYDTKEADFDEQLHVIAERNASLSKQLVNLRKAYFSMREAAHARATELREALCKLSGIKKVEETHDD